MNEKQRDRDWVDQLADSIHVMAEEACRQMESDRARAAALRGMYAGAIAAIDLQYPDLGGR